MAEVIWTEPAVADLEAITGYIALDKPDAARRLARSVFNRVEQLAVFPLSGGKPRELTGTPYRQLVLPPLKIFYRLSDKKAYVVYVMRSERRFRFDAVREREP